MTPTRVCQAAAVQDVRTLSQLPRQDLTAGLRKAHIEGHKTAISTLRTLLNSRHLQPQQTELPL